MEEGRQESTSIEASLGASLQSGDTDARRIAASLMGKARTERKKQAALANAKKRKGVPLSEEHKLKLREAQAARRERERQEKMAAGLLPVEPAPKKPRGRPKKTEEGTGA